VLKSQSQTEPGHHFSVVFLSLEVLAFGFDDKLHLYKCRELTITLCRALLMNGGKNHKIEIAKIAAAFGVSKSPKSWLSKLNEVGTLVGIVTSIAAVALALYSAKISREALAHSEKTYSLDKLVDFSLGLTEAQQEYCDTDGLEVTYDYKLKFDRLLAILPLVEDKLTSGDWTVLATISWNICSIEQRIAYADLAISSSSSAEDNYAARLTKAHLLFQQSLESSNAELMKTLVASAEREFDKAISSVKTIKNSAVKTFLQVGAYRVWWQCRMAVGDEAGAIAIAIKRDELWDDIKEREERVNLAAYDEKEVNLSCIPRPKCPSQIALIPPEVRQCTVKKPQQDAEVYETATPLPPTTPTPADASETAHQIQNDRAVSPVSDATLEPLEIKPEADNKIELVKIKVFNSTNFSQQPIINGEIYPPIRSGQIVEIELSYSHQFQVSKVGSNRKSRRYDSSQLWQDDFQNIIPVFHISSCCMKFNRRERN
jgi:hypothetical protein